MLVIANPTRPRLNKLQAPEKETSVVSIFCRCWSGQQGSKERKRRYREIHTKKRYTSVHWRLSANSSENKKRERKREMLKNWPTSVWRLFPRSLNTNFDHLIQTVIYDYQFVSVCLPVSHWLASRWPRSMAPISLDSLSLSLSILLPDNAVISRQ